MALCCQVTACTSPQAHAVAMDATPVTCCAPSHVLTMCRHVIRYERWHCGSVSLRALRRIQVKEADEEVALCGHDMRTAGRS